MPGVYVLEALLATSNCPAFDTVVVLAYEPLTFEVETTVSCVNKPTGTVTVIQLQGGLPLYSFMLDNGTLQSDSIFENVPMGEHLVTVLDSVGCGDSLAINIEGVAYMPYQSFDFYHDICGPSDTLVLDVTVDFPNVEYHWTNGWDGPVVNITKGGTYSLILTNGCDSQFSDFEVEDHSVYATHFDVPNVFSPNNDGINDTFLPVSGLVPQQFEMKIFSRWGGLVYQTNSWRGWDGELRGKPVPSDVYIYVLQAKLTDCKGEVWEYNKKGDVTVLR